MPARDRYARATRDVTWVLVAKTLLLIALAQLFFPASHRPAQTADAVAVHLLATTTEGRQ